MYLSKLGLFKEKSALKNYNLTENLNHLTMNLKNNILRRMLCAYLEQELYSLTLRNLSNQDKSKQKRFTAKLKFTRGKRQAKKRLMLRNNYNYKMETKAVELNTKNRDLAISLKHFHNN